MKQLSLNGPWTLDIPGSAFMAVPAEVPGSVYHDLLTAGRIPDPFYRDNETEALKLMEYDFHYSRAFQVDGELLDCGAVLLRCEGLDTLAAVYINGAEAGRADNMHRVWEFDVKDLLREGENTIAVHFASPTKFIRESYAADPADGTADAMEGFPSLRKAHCMFGWDWGPRLPDAGIWRDISLIGVDTARIRDVLVKQFHEDGRAALEIDTHIIRLTDAPAEVRVSVTAPDGTVLTGGGETCRIEVPDPQLWWPAGYGGQPLYRVEVELVSGGTRLDGWSHRIGLRTMTVSRVKSEHGESFSHCVNGVDVFAMGMDYIPEDNLLPRVTPERTRRLLEDARAANVNTIRVWGGGYYPDDYFYDICDELGLLVWQDFMFACAVYNLTEAFEETITAEFVDNIRRLRSHPSLALWCGNNEMEQFAGSGLWIKAMRQKSDYIKMFQYIIPKVLKKEDPQAFYWPSSPSSGGDFDEPGDPSRGDVHDWDVWHGLKPFTDYRNYLFSYVSEFGFQSFPCMETIESFTLPEDRNIFSYIMEKHQRNATANGRIVTYLSQTYLYPATLDKLVYASQLLQAQAMQYGVEHWRRNRGRCMGAVIWQLNDCWPVASWAGIDYFGRWKALQYYAKRFFAPVLVSCHEEGLVDQEDISVNTEHIDPRKTARLNVSNETMEAFAGRIDWSLRRPDASVIEEGRFGVAVPALAAVWLPEQDFTKYGPYDCYYAYRLTDRAGRTVGEGSVLFCAPKHFHFQDPGLTVRLEGDEAVVTASAYARSVEVQCGPDVLLEDNYFDMNGGERRVKILRGEAKDAAVRSVYDIR
ncbi:MAG: glycoside hydrolase family 2 protein [Oscillospiraceae bacterium]|nr:glycoside hydrolase family 2 protein [Oscillospiraceae bacterium]